MQAAIVTRSVADSYGKTLALGGIAEALAEAGQREQATAVAAQAEEAARSITDLDQQAQALAKVAEMLAKEGLSRSARRVAAAACAVAPWSTAAKSVLLIDPTAYTMLARVMPEKAGRRLDAG